MYMMLSNFLSCLCCIALQASNKRKIMALDTTDPQPVRDDARWLEKAKAVAGSDAVAVMDGLRRAAAESVPGARMSHNPQAASPRQH